MKAKLYCLFLGLFGFSTYAQSVSIVGTGVNGWPGSQNTPEISLSSADNISYFIPNLLVTDGFVKFRKDFSWVVNWGGTNFPSGVGVQDGGNIPTVAGTYDVTFNISNGSYTFITSSNFPEIGIWGPAVDSQNGFAGQDVNMSTADGIHYTLSGFYFSSGQAYFRQDNATNFVWGSTSYPTGTAVQNGPSIFIPGGEHFVTFNRITGAYSFSFPSVGILGSALNGFDADDINLSTTDGFSYNLDLNLNVGEVKFRKDDSWTINWGSNAYPSGTGVQDGSNIPIPESGSYSVSFDRLSGHYDFIQLLANENFTIKSTFVYPNPTNTVWAFQTQGKEIDKIEILDVLGKIMITTEKNNTTIDASNLNIGIYFAKLYGKYGFEIIRLMKL